MITNTPCSAPNPCDEDGLCERHDIEQAHTEGEHTLCGLDCPQVLQDRLNRTYTERADLLALLATFLPSVLTPCKAPDAPGTDPEETGWHRLYTRLDGEQLSFTIKPDDVRLFPTTERVPPDDPRAQWDGHNTDAKYDRIRTYVASGGNETVHLTADVVAVNTSGKFLAIKRRCAPHEGKWALPGGYVEPGETVEEAAARELLEETGVFALPTDLTPLGAFTDPNRDERGRYVTVAFLAHVPDNITAVAGTDARDTAWLPLAAEDRPAPLAFDHDEIVAKAAAKIMRGVQA